MNWTGLLFFLTMFLCADSDWPHVHGFGVRSACANSIVFAELSCRTNPTICGNLTGPQACAEICLRYPANCGAFSFENSSNTKCVLLQSATGCSNQLPLDTEPTAVYVKGLPLLPTPTPSTTNRCVDLFFDCLNGGSCVSDPLALDGVECFCNDRWGGWRCDLPISGRRLGQTDPRVSIITKERGEQYLVWKIMDKFADGDFNVTVPIRLKNNTIFYLSHSGSLESNPVTFVVRRKFLPLPSLPVGTNVSLKLVFVKFNKERVPLIDTWLLVGSANPCDNFDCGSGRCIVERTAIRSLKGSTLAPMCYCQGSFSATSCSFDAIEQCRFNGKALCLNNGQCQLDSINRPFCLCEVGFSGDRCQFINGPGSNACGTVAGRSLCLNGGTCVVDGSNQLRCICPEEFIGDHCGKLKPRDVCKDNSLQCQNGGTCTMDGRGGGFCICSIGYFGDRCQTVPCYSGRCQNGGTCSVYNSSLALCLCPSGFEGNRCQTVIPRNQCQTNMVRCQNGGTCVWDSRKLGYCICRKNYTGDRCQTASQPELSCTNGGTTRCICPSGYTGDRCEKGPTTTFNIPLFSLPKEVFFHTLAFDQVRSWNTCPPPTQGSRDYIIEFEVTADRAAQMQLCSSVCHQESECRGFVYQRHRAGIANGRCYLTKRICTNRELRENPLYGTYKKNEPQGMRCFLAECSDKENNLTFLNYVASRQKYTDCAQACLDRGSACQSMQFGPSHTTFEGSNLLLDCYLYSARSCVGRQQSFSAMYCERA